MKLIEFIRPSLRKIYITFLILLISLILTFIFAIAMMDVTSATLTSSIIQIIYAILHPLISRTPSYLLNLLLELIYYYLIACILMQIGKLRKTKKPYKRR